MQTKYTDALASGRTASQSPLPVLVLLLVLLLPVLLLVLLLPVLLLQLPVLLLPVAVQVQQLHETTHQKFLQVLAGSP